MTINTYYLSILGELAAVGAPWECCRHTLIKLTDQYPPETVEKLVNEYRDRHRSDSDHYPDGNWLVTVASRYCNDAYNQQIFFAVIVQMAEGLEERKRDGETIRLCEQVIDLCEGTTLKELPESLQKQLIADRDFQTRRIKECLARAYTRENRTDEAVELIQNSKPYSRVELDKQIRQLMGDRAHDDVMKKITSEDTASGCINKALRISESNFEDADRLFKRALELYDKEDQEPPRDFPALPPRLESIVDIYLRNRDYEAAERWQDRKLNSVEAVFGENPLILRMRHYQDFRAQAAIKTGLNQFDAADTFYRQAIEMSEEGSKPLHLVGAIMEIGWFIKALMDYAMFLEKRECRTEAESAFARVKETDATAGQYIGALLGPIEKTLETPRGMLYSPLRGYASASLYASESDIEVRLIEFILNNVEGLESIPHQLHLALITRAARAHHDVGRLSAAHHFYRQAIALANEEVPQNERAHPDYLIDLLEGYSKLCVQMNLRKEVEHTQIRLKNLRQKYYRHE